MTLVDNYSDLQLENNKSNNLKFCSHFFYLCTFCSFCKNPLLYSGKKYFDSVKNVYNVQFYPMSCFFLRKGLMHVQKW